MNAIELCYVVEQSKISKFWMLVVKSLQDMPVEWVNTPLGEFSYSGTQYYGTLSRKWQVFPLSSKPPFAKTKKEWQAFCGGRNDIEICSIVVLVDTPVGQDALNRIIQQFDCLCDKGVFVAGTWGNLLTPESAAEAATAWNAIRLVLPTP